MLIEIASLIIINTSQIKETNVINLSPNRPVRSFVVGDSQHQVSERERIIRENTERIRQEVIARERAERASRGGSVLEVIGEYRVWGGCVPYAWSQGMQTSGYGWARNYPVTQTPQKFAITKESWTGHAVVIEQDLGDKVIIRDANYIPHKITRRIIPKSLIKGYLT
jgi:hypothetical protein